MIYSWKYQNRLIYFYRLAYVNFIWNRGLNKSFSRVSLRDFTAAKFCFHSRHLHLEHNFLNTFKQKWEVWSCLYELNLKMSKQKAPYWLILIFEALGFVQCHLKTATCHYLPRWILDVLIRISNILSTWKFSSV